MPSPLPGPCPDLLPRCRARAEGITYAWSHAHPLEAPLLDSSLTLCLSPGDHLVPYADSWWARPGGLQGPKCHRQPRLTLQSPSGSPPLLFPRRERDILFPGYTHLQRAQPIRWSHWILR